MVVRAPLRVVPAPHRRVAECRQAIRQEVPAAECRQVIQALLAVDIPAVTRACPAVGYPGGYPGTPGRSGYPGGYPGGGMPGAPGGLPGNAAGTAAPAEPEPETLLTKAEYAMQQGNEKQAFDYLYASALAEEKTDVLDKFLWVNAFKRPAMAVRWGIGVQVTVSPKNYEGSYYPVGSTQSIPDKPTRSRQNDGQSRGGPGMAGPGGPGMAGPGGPGGRMNPGMSGPGGMYPGAAGTNAPAGSEVLAKATGELGDELRRYLQERVDRGEYGEILVELASAPSRPAPGSGYPGIPAVAIRRTWQWLSRCTRQWISRCTRQWLSGRTWQWISRHTRQWLPRRSRQRISGSTAGRRFPSAGGGRWRWGGCPWRGWQGASGSRGGEAAGRRRHAASRNGATWGRHGTRRRSRNGRRGESFRLDGRRYAAW